jgi:2-polyprenyl-6-hydroxyphenyl methylase/3-demethylubiquinone-9 3-methyltransferase
MCGRCKDKYGVSRQIIPLALGESLFQSDPAKSKYAMDKMLKMKKIIIADLFI